MSNISNNPYYNQVKANLPRVLSLFDNDITSKSYGYGDRYHWAWGLIDFGNGTFQGAANGLVRLWKSGLWPYETKQHTFLKRINAIFKATENLVRSDGSLEEAFPYEGSFCVTALVAYDLSCALELLNNDLDNHVRESYLNTLDILFRYLVKSDESHAFISNHLATASAALYRWNSLSGDQKAKNKAGLLLEKILEHQSKNGWFKEYEGADPGYQTLCTCYLADIHRRMPELSLSEPLKKSLEFLCKFAHPDGSFGGSYGSRSTRFYYPSGVLSLASEFSEAATLSSFMAKSISKQKVITLSSIDEPNLIPMFNSYVSAAVAYENFQTDWPIETEVPSLSKGIWRSLDKESGIFIDKGKNHYTIVNVNKGGIVYHFQGGQPKLLNVGVVLQDRKGRIASTQGFSSNRDLKIEDDIVQILSPFIQTSKRLPTPYNFIILRALSVTLFKFEVIREIVKKVLVKFLITRKKHWAVNCTRKIKLGEDLSLVDDLSETTGYDVLEVNEHFCSFHMASKGYWQIQDEVKP